MEWKGASAWMAIKWMRSEAWSYAEMEEAGREVWGGMVGGVAESIGGNAAWAPGDQVADWLGKAFEMNDLGRTIEGYGAEVKARLILASAESLRESVAGCRDDQMPASCAEEYAFCTSFNEDQRALDACRLKMGYGYSEQSAETASLAMLGRMGDLLAGLDEPGGWALRLAQMLGDCRGDKLDEAMLIFLKSWVTGVGSVDDGFEIMESEGQLPDEESREMGRVPWRRLASCDNFGKLDGFPWRLWVAMAMPSRMDRWGDRLGSRSDAELGLAMELSRINWGNDGDSDKSAAMCARAPAMIERMELEGAAGPSKQKKRIMGL